MPQKWLVLTSCVAMACVMLLCLEDASHEAPQLLAVDEYQAKGVHVNKAPHGLRKRLTPKQQASAASHSAVKVKGVKKRKALPGVKRSSIITRTTASPGRKKAATSKLKKAAHAAKGKLTKRRLPGPRGDSKTLPKTKT